MSLAERYVQIKSLAAKTLQSSRLSNHQLLGNAYKQTTLLRCKCYLSDLIGFEWIDMIHVFHHLIVKGLQTKIQHIVTVPLKHFRS